VILHYNDNEDTKSMPVENPFPDTHSGYGKIVDGAFISIHPNGSPMRQFHEQAHDQFRAFVKSPTFPCVFGFAAVKSNQYFLGAYRDMTTPQTAEGIMHDVIRFQDEFQVPDSKKGPHGILRSMLVAFQTPQPKTPMEGAEALYTLMKNMTDLNQQHYPWPEGFSDDVESTEFGFAAGRTAHFLAHFYENAPAIAPARKSELHFVVLNPHSVVAAYKEISGMPKHDRAKAIIRGRQQQPLHPALGNFGESRDWPQYTLLDTDQQTQSEERELRKRIFGECPFKPPAQT